MLIQNPTSTTQSISERAYLGCFKDERGCRDLPRHEYRSGKLNSVDLCLTSCEKRGYLYAGLQHGYESEKFFLKI